MADTLEDPREVSWHPRHAAQVFGHEAAKNGFVSTFNAGRPHHAWLLTGPQGIGKATLAYALAHQVLAANADSATTWRWIRNRAHPNLMVLERSFTTTKPRKLRNEISVDDSRAFIDFFSRTASGDGWRVGLVDAADDLNSESANALLKLVEEPPDKALFLLVCHAPGRLLRTLRSRCRRLPLEGLTVDQTVAVLDGIPLPKDDNKLGFSELSVVAKGSPGLALQLMQSDGAKAFQTFAAARRLDAITRAAIGNMFAARAAAVQDYEVFMGLLLGWVAERARADASAPLADVHAALARQQGMVAAYNLDRRVAVMESLTVLDQAQKAALKVA
jgi:DNA polymerase III subunit delta'